MTFASLGLLDPLLKALEGLGHGTPTPIQAQAIPPALKGRDLLAAAQTGTGKTAGFALPLLQRLTLEGPQVAANSVRALVLVPTRELAEQVHASIRDYGQHLPLRTAVAYGGVSINPQMMKLRKGVDILVATPGRLLDLYRQNAVKFAQLQALVLDEADRMLDLGFARELDELFAALPRKRQTLLFSATFSDAIRTLARELLRDPLSIEVSPRNTAAKSVRQWLVPVDKKRKAELFCHLLQANRWRQALVFAKTRKSVEELVGLTLIGQTLQRREEPDFAPEHRVPQTAPGGVVLKKPKKPKKPKAAESAGKPGKIHLGSWFDSSAPTVKAVRKAPGFGAGAAGKPKKRPSGK